MLLYSEHTRCYQTSEHVSKRTSEQQGHRPLTFSKPKNLSLPSPRRGPALTSSFSSGVGSGALGSFLMGAVPVAGLVGALQRSQYGPLRGCMAHGETDIAPLQSAKEAAHDGRRGCAW